jgi:aminoglycoside phosphotransferase (APT) family kinase protein
MVSPLTGGSSRETILAEVPGDRAPRRVVARRAGAGPLAGTAFTLAREAATYRAVARSAVPVPRLVAVSDDGSAFAVEEVPGVDHDGAAAIDDYLAVLARLHATPAGNRPPDHAGFDPAGAEDLALWEAVATTRITRPAPVVEVAFDALRRHGADRPPQVVLCHGDAGVGNFLHDGARVTGLIDWEFAHTGDPHEDLAWVAVRALLTRTDLGDFAGRVRTAYAAPAGLELDPHRFHVATAGVLARMVVSCLAALDNAGPDHDRTVQLVGLPVMEAQLVRALARLDGVALDRPDALPGPDPAFAAEVAAGVADTLDAVVVPAVAGQPFETTARRLRFATAQLGSALAADVARSTVPDAAVPDPADLTYPSLFDGALARVAVLPALRPTALAPVADLEDPC